jgi:hypothetical protein
VNIGFHPRPASPSSLRNLCALSVSALSFSSLPHLLALFTLVALRDEASLEGKNEGSVVQGSTACRVYPACREPRREERREHGRRVNLLSLRLQPAVDCKLSAVSGHSSSANSHRITSFAHPHPLTPIESHLCKKQGGGVPPTPNRRQRASSPCATRRNVPNSIPFIGLLDNLRTPRVGGRSSRLIQMYAVQSQLTHLESALTKKPGGALLIYRQPSPLPLAGCGIFHGGRAST